MGMFSQLESVIVRILEGLIPRDFASGPEAFSARSLIFFCLTIGGFGLLSMMVFVVIADGSFPLRRVGTLLLITSLLTPILFIRYVQSMKSLSLYAMSLTILTIFYIDYNNQSVAGPATALWVLPPALAVLLFRIKAAFIVLLISTLAMVLNFYWLRSEKLPPSIVDPKNWYLAKVVIQTITTSLIILCTFGLSAIVFRYSKKLEQQLLERKKRMKEFAKLKEKAEASAKSKAIFLATMSHELRTPLNSVIGNAQLLEKEVLPDRVRMRVNDIAIAGNLLLTLINDVLDFSKLEENKVTLLPEPYDLVSQLRELSRILVPRFKPGVELHLQGLEGELYINADQNRLAQVFMNLLSNAAKFTDSGAVTVNLTCVDDIRVAIEDSGVGIKQEDISRLFQRFSQVGDDSKRNVEGTGLGLVISKGLVELMGGAIDVSSEIGLGSTFTVVLPKSLIVPTPITNQLSEADQTSLDLEGVHILVVDDVVMNCTVLEAMLEGFGQVNVDLAYSGGDAIRFIEEHIDVDIVFMDMRMPEMDGIETTKRLREMGFNGLIVAVTANASVEDRVACEEAGMNGFLSKPLVITELRNVLIDLLERG